MLLDAHSVKTLLLDLPSMGSGATTAAAGGKKSAAAAAASRKAPPSYTKVVVKGMTRVEMTLKVVMSGELPAEQFVEQYAKLVPDADAAEFQKVLDMKGVRKVDQAPYAEMFRAKSPHGGSSSIHAHHATAATAAKTASQAPASSASQGEESRIKKLENLIKKRL